MVLLSPGAASQNQQTEWTTPGPGHLGVGLVTGPVSEALLSTSIDTRSLLGFVLSTEASFLLLPY